MVFGERLTLLLDLLEEDLEVVRLHEEDRSSYELQKVDIFAKLLSHFVADLETTSALGLILHLLIGDDLLAVPSQP